ncbi:MAG: hypothetical protein N4A72_06480 [Bacteroidales bacterium]|jgi:hypothetical protein|nr:hypothetical protein [Bacteroidales bacterium]
MIKSFFSGLTRRFFRWLFASELNKLNQQLLQNSELTSECTRQLNIIRDLLKGLDISVDVHEYPSRHSPSWAVISLQGRKMDYIKFINLGDRDLKEITRFLRHFDIENNRVKIDAHPVTTNFLKIHR